MAIRVVFLLGVIYAAFDRVLLKQKYAWVQEMRVFLDYCLSSLIRTGFEIIDRGIGAGEAKSPEETADGINKDIIVSNLRHNLSPPHKITD